MPITVTYTKPGTNPIKDLAGNEMDSFTDAVTNNVTSITQLAITAFGPQPADNADVPVTITADRNDSGVEVVLGLTSLGSPTAADFGTDATDLAGFIDLGVVAVTAGTSSAELDLPDGLNGNYTLHVLATGGGDGDVVSSGSTAINTVTVSPVIYDENFQGPVDSYETQVDGIDIFISVDTVYTHDPAMTTPAHPTATVGGLTCNRAADFGSVITRFPNITEGDSITITAKAMIDNVSGAANTDGRVAIFFRDNASAVMDAPHDDTSFNGQTGDQVALDGVYGPYVAPAGTTTVEVYYYGRQNRTNWIWRDLKVEKA